MSQSGDGDKGGDKPGEKIPEAQGSSLADPEPEAGAGAGNVEEQIEE